MAWDDYALGAAANSKIIEIMLRDSATGQGKTALVHDSAGMTAYYVREGGTAVEIALVHGAAGDAYSSGKFSAVDDVNMPGVYQLHVPNAALATAANSCTILVKATGIINSKTKILILAHDPRLANIPAALGNVAHGGAAATLTLLSAGITNAAGVALAISGSTAGVTIAASGGTALDCSSAGGNGCGLALAGNGAGPGLSATGGASAAGIYGVGGATGPGMLCTGGGNDAAADGFRAVAGGALANGVETDRVSVTSTTTLAGVVACSDAVTVAKGVAITNSTATGAGLAITGNTSGAGIEVLGGNIGPGIRCSGGGNNANANGVTLASGGVAAQGISMDRGAVTGAMTFGTPIVANATQIETADATDQIRDACTASLVAHNLDHLMKTAVVNNADMTAEVTDGTVLSNLMSATSDTSTYAVATDSQEAIAADVTATHAHASSADTAAVAVKVVTDKLDTMIEVI